MTIETLPNPKPAHTGVAAPPFGPSVFVVVRHDGKLCAVEPTRHDAVWQVERFHDCDDYELRYVPVGAVPLLDLSLPSER
jgi:hypothetical protein